MRERMAVRESGCKSPPKRSVSVGEITVPGISEFGIAPRPKLFSGSNMSIRDVHDSGILLIIVAAKEIKVRFRNHVRRGHGNVPVPGNIHAVSIIHAVIKIPGNWE